MIIEIPGAKTLQIDHLVLDYNGTVACDGFLDDGMADRLRALDALGLDLHVITADTNGTAARALEGLPVSLHLFPQEEVASEKQRLVQRLGKALTAAVGNGKNDLLMVQEAVLSIAVIGREGAYGKTAQASDLWVKESIDALDLFLEPHRLLASLRA